MQSNDLLMDDDRYKWYLLQYLELNKNAYCSIDQLGDILEISRYKLEKYLQELQEELEENHFEATVKLLETGEIEVHDLTHAIVKKMRICLVERSLSYQIFHRYVTKETSLDKQIEELHVSRSSTYRLSKRLKDQLAAEGFQLKKNQLIGDECAIRSFLFGLYYEMFNGLASPFDEEIQKQAKEVFRHLEHYLNLSLPKTKEHKLLFFVSVALIRMGKSHPIDQVYIEYEENAATDYLVKWLEGHFSLTPKEMQGEIAALLLFCQMMEVDLRQELTFIEGQEIQQAGRLVDEFLHYLAEHSRFEIHRLKEDTALVDGLLRINRRWLIYHFRETTFVTKIQRRYFQEINPKLDEMIQDFIEKIAHRGLFHSDQERNKLYYDYLFFLITQISVEELEDPVFICIDFSHGSSYNEYIQTMLSSLQSMNICYEEKLSTKTQIYLSDFLIDTLPCHQMIWKRPPTPEDWAEFGHLLLTVKGGAYE
ncbi:helix-turn-helix domain-containing protein [Candidatus Enterococcus murrayae]|uniref:Helix-turn-helix domain-containing protein n=1 Tax=Candidatus Enterococcus murrayae TaxID=2815321 RepID=A0ABS3HIV7_9ENTE|nr:helix-turn-helix domain-containing protein [Enterococcus sp. MJM16]MBO0453364.1 helix-turn-helix domain-containing protein [Enterococcus sp. MJM16]